MAKFRLNRAMLFVLVTAFLSMQWAPAHIHLAEHHDHGGSHHQHEVEAHAHQSITLEDNSNHSTFQTDKSNIYLGLLYNLDILPCEWIFRTGIYNSIDCRCSN